MHPDLRIPIPRKIDPPRAKPYWELVRNYGTSRERMARFIYGIGGYHHGYQRWAIEFNVKTYGADMDQDILWDRLYDMCEVPDPFDDRYPDARAAWLEAYKEHNAALFDWGLEEARQSWEDSDVPYETFCGQRIDWSWSFAGRCGGHLVVDECAGIKIAGKTDEELYDDLVERVAPGREYLIDHSRVRDLFILCVQLTVEATPEKASRAVEDAAAFRLWSSFAEEKFDAIVKEKGQ